jgi:uncharacterized protein (DUF433 family)
MLTKSAYEHIVIDESGIPAIAGTNTKVVELILDKVAYGWSAEELHFQHPHLTLGQIHSALAYYWDHQEALEAEIEQRLERIERLRSHHEPSALAKRLRQQGLLS